MKLLALDTAVQACSVALRVNEETVSFEYEEMARGHASALIPMVDRVMQQAAVGFDELDGYGVTIGPGGFSGLRIALAAARGFGLAHQKPVIGITTLEAIAAQVGPQTAGGYDAIVTCLDARRADLYAQSFCAKTLSPRQDPIAVLPEKIPDQLAIHAQSLLVAGDSFERLAPILENSGCQFEQSPVRYPDARFVAQLAHARFSNHKGSAPRPLYLRPPDAELPKNGGRLRP